MGGYSNRKEAVPWTLVQVLHVSLHPYRALCSNAVRPCHALYLSRGSDTVLGETGDPCELFMVDECDENPLGSIKEKVNVSIVIVATCDIITSCCIASWSIVLRLTTGQSSVEWKNQMIAMTKMEGTSSIKNGVCACYVYVCCACVCM